jgi:hypothetical protein
MILSTSTVERGFSTVKRHLTDARLSLSNKRLNQLLLIRNNVPILQGLDHDYETKIVAKAIKLYLESSERGRYNNTKTRFTKEATAGTSGTVDQFLPVSVSHIIERNLLNHELLGDFAHVGPLPEISESDIDNQSDSESEDSDID